MPTQSAPATSSPSPREQLMQLISGFKISACISVVAQLGIADLLAGGPKPVSQLAAAAQVNEDALYRVLRALASVGVFTETAPRAFANTPASELMRSGTRDSMRDVMIWMGDAFHFRVYAELMHSVKTGGTAVKKFTGSEAFEYFEQDKAEGELFNAAMTSFSAALMPAVLEAYDFGGLGTLADVAGGHGFALTSILQEHSDLRGILFDLPHVVSGAKPRIESLGLAGRCQIVAGDFFQSVPSADSYVMKNIIHDWDDARALTILKNCAGAMGGKGKVILIENVISPGNEPHFAKWLDIDMLTLAGGRERTQAEFASLFSQAGLRFSRIVPTKSPVCVVEAVKA
jgi:O-methyltransferase domain/Dimerisation domain